MHSKLALKLYGMINARIIKSNAMFWRDFFDKEKVDEFDIELELWEKETTRKRFEFSLCF